jgi:hypothetical protein
MCVLLALCISSLFVLLLYTYNSTKRLLPQELFVSFCLHFAQLVVPMSYIGRGVSEELCCAWLAFCDAGFCKPLLSPCFLKVVVR